LSRHCNIDMILGDVARADLDRRAVCLSDGSFMPYDRLVLATGSTHGYLGHKGHGPAGSVPAISKSGP
jgi:NADH:ubiquinone reductase (H+-translocating)